MTRRASVRLQVFDGFLCPLVFSEEVEGMTGEKRIVRVGVPSLHVLLQAKPERAAIFPRSVGQGSRKRAAK
jgi:hypothetical protein